MTLSLSSALHYWDARYGVMARVGGMPVHVRSSAGSWTDQQGVVQSAIVNSPRLNWATIAGERRQVMTLEEARTNNLFDPSNFSSSSWTKTSMTVATGVLDPAGRTGACTLTATGAAATVQQAPSSGASIVRTNSIWLRRRTGAGQIYIVNTMNSGWVPVTLTSQWQRFVTTGTAATVRCGGVQIAVSGDAVDAWTAQNEDASTVSSEIGTAAVSPTTRAADSFFWNFSPAPQAMMCYVRFIERGSALLTTSPRLFQIGKTDNSDPRFLVYATGGFYRVFHGEPAGSAAALLAVAPAYGDVVEIVAVANANGSVDIYQSINAAPVTTASDATARAFSSSWSDTRLWVDTEGSSPGLNDFAELKIVKYADVTSGTAQGRMDELRAFELDARGQVL